MKVAEDLDYEVEKGIQPTQHIIYYLRDERTETDYKSRNIGPRLLDIKSDDPRRSQIQGFSIYDCTALYGELSGS